MSNSFFFSSSDFSGSGRATFSGYIDLFLHQHINKVNVMQIATTKTTRIGTQIAIPRESTGSIYTTFFCDVPIS